MSAAGWWSYPTESAYNAVGDGFLNELRNGDVEAAYARLSPGRRASMSLAEFRPLAEHLAFRTNSEHRRGRTEAWAEFITPVRACLRAALFVDDAEWPPLH